MGWFNDFAPRHEGYLIGVVSGQNERGSIAFRELGADDSDKSALRIVQVGCDCGWRSQRLRAPYGTAYHGFVMLPPHECDGYDEKLLGRKPFETVCRELWREHAVSCTHAGLDLIED